MSRLLTPEDVASRFHVTPRTIQRWARERRVPHTRIGRRVLFTPEQVAAITDAYSIEPARVEASASIPNPAYRPTAVVVGIDPKHRRSGAA